jgi:hypothetical protein
LALAEPQKQMVPIRCLLQPLQQAVDVLLKELHLVLAGRAVGHLIAHKQNLRVLVIHQAQAHLKVITEAQEEMVR